MKNSERMLVASLKRYADRTGTELQLLSGDWIAALSRNGRRHLVMGYDLGLNGSAAARVANDKGASFDVLKSAGVAALEHRVFLHPRYLDFMPDDGNWPGLLRTFDEFGRDAVLKDNEGTGGMEVFRVRSLTELEQRAHQLFQISRSIALAPFVCIEDETRFVMFEETCVLAYAKQRPSVTGDGRRTLGELVASAAMPFDNPGRSLTSIPTAGETIPLQWRHNLGLGARAVTVDPASEANSTLLALARRAMDTLTLRFASIDVVRVGGQPMVLEANSGVMLEVASHSDFGGAALADQIYHRALDLAFADMRPDATYARPIVPATQ